MKSVFALEEVLGTNWLNKIGIVLIVLAVAYFGIKELGHLGPLGKVVLSYAISLGLLVGGIYLEKLARYRVFSYAFIGGGWALLFWTTYALNHVEAMRVMDSVAADLILMFLVAMAMVAHTLRYRSQVVTGMAFLLAYWTVSLSNDDVYSLTAGAILAVALVAIILRMEWFQLEVFGVLSSYASHIYWLYRILGPGGAQGHAFPDYHASTAILLFYWITYRISYVVRKPKSPRSEHTSTVAAIVNTLLLLGAMKFQSVRPELAFYALLIIGAVEFSIGQLPLLKRRREAFIVLSVLGAALMIAAVPFRYSGNNVAILWLVGAEALLAAGLMVSEVVFRRLGLLAGLLVGLHLLGIDFQELMVARRASDEHGPRPGCNVRALRFRVLFERALCGQTVGALLCRCPGLYPPLRPLLHRSFLSGSRSLGPVLRRLDRCCFRRRHASPGSARTKAQIRPPATAIRHSRLARVVSRRCRQPAQRRPAIYPRPESPHHAAPHRSGVLHYRPLRAQEPRERSTHFPRLLRLRRHRAHHRAHLLRGPGTLAAFRRDRLRRSAAGSGTAHRLSRLVLAHPFAQRIGHHVRRARRPSQYATLAYDSAASIGRSARGGRNLLDRPSHPVAPGPHHLRPHRLQLGRHRPDGYGSSTRPRPRPGSPSPGLSFAIALALVMRQIGYRPLGWQANMVAACALVRAFTFNLSLEQSFWPGISLRLCTVALVAAGLYFLSRKSTTDNSEFSRAISYLHTFAATALLALLAWHESPNAWLAPLWAVFALVLALVDRRFELEDLRWQAHALAALALARCVAVNLYATDTWHGVSVRLLSLALVAVVFYAMSLIVRLPEEFRQRDFHHIYSWAASTLVALLLWYELQTLSIAVGWAVFGLILFEYGLWRKIRQFRFQAYVALAASFGRIFFANLTAGAPGEFWGPRLYTVLPITLILFFVYAQLSPRDQAANADRSLHFDMFVAYLGTGTVVALLYFQFADEWLVTAWAS